jgi:hypothetical protein
MCRGYWVISHSSGFMYIADYGDAKVLRKKEITARVPVKFPRENRNVKKTLRYIFLTLEIVYKD